MNMRWNRDEIVLLGCWPKDDFFIITKLPEAVTVKLLRSEVEPRVDVLLRSLDLEGTFLLLKIRRESICTIF